MFTVKAIRIGKCVMCDREVEVFDVEAPDQQIFGHLCIPDFKKLVKAAKAARPLPPAPDPTANA